MNEQILREIICTRFLDGDTEFPIDANTKLLDEGICDSLGLVQLVNEIESRCPGICIQDQEVTHTTFGSISAILRFLEQKQRILG